MSALLSNTMRSLGISRKQLRQLRARQTARRHPAGYSVAKLLELLYVQRPKPVALVPGEENGNFSLLASYHHGLALGRIQKGRQTLLRIGSGDRKHNVYFRQNGRFRQPALVHGLLDRPIQRFVIGD